MLSVSIKSRWLSGIIQSVIILDVVAFAEYPKNRL
jgi:hypothetical protein